MRAAIYARVSTADGRQDTENQLAELHRLDRFTREGVGETFEYIKRLTSHGVQFVSFTEEHFRTTGPAGELMIAVPRGLRSKSATGSRSASGPD